MCATLNAMDYAKELAFAKQLAAEAGEIMKKYFRAENIGTEWKEDSTPLTVADTTINSRVIEAVKETFPDHGVYGEEESYNVDGREWVWVCDPIDGTAPFSHGLPISTFALALARNGEPVMGVVYDPFMDRLFWAAQGQGAFLNGTPIQVSNSTDFQNKFIDLEGFPTSSSTVLHTEFNVDLALNQLGAHTTHLWSVILPGMLVASGDFLATLFNVDKPMDGAAVKIIVEEAGGKVTDLYGQEQRYDGPIKGYVASNGKVHDQILEVLAKAMTQ